jgi:hypothetical protein
MINKGVLVLFFFPLALLGQTLHFGANLITPGEICEFTAPMNAKAKLEVGRLKIQSSQVRGALLLPDKFDLRKPWPLLIVSVPSGGQSIPYMRAYTNAALALGYAVLAADGPQVPAEVDSIQFGWAMLSSALEQMNRNWPPTKNWPMACAGFSGGAKRAGSMAAALVQQNARVIGIFMGGANEDRATLGLQLYKPGERFKQVPIFLSNGANDPIAGPEPAASVKQSMMETGFRNIRSESYEAGHRLDEANLKEALRWFKEKNLNAK